MNQEWKLVPAEPTPQMVNAALKISGIFPQYAAMLAAAPVPPAGGEVEVLAWRVLGYNFNTEAFALDYAKWAEDVEPVRYLVDRAHVNRLQAENAALQQRLNEADQRVDDLQSELPKARELIERVVASRGNIVLSEFREFLARQSEPAAKVDCGNCAFVEGVCTTGCESRRIRESGPCLQPQAHPARCGCEQVEP